MKRLDGIEQTMQVILSFVGKLSTPKVNTHYKVTNESPEVLDLTGFSVENDGNLPTMADVTSCLEVTHETLPAGLDMDDSFELHVMMDAPEIATVETALAPTALAPTALAPKPHATTPPAPTPLTPPTIPAGVFEEMFSKSASVSNYAKNLVFATFTKDDLLSSNCSGALGKKALERDPRMAQIKEMTLKKYRVEDKDSTWRACRKAIDGSIRKLRMQSRC